MAYRASVLGVGRPALTAAVVAFVVGVACTGPVRNARDFRLKARHSAQAAASAVATSALAAQIVQERAAFASYVAVVLDDAERDATSVESTFASLQPPDRRSDRLREQLGGVLGDVVDAISGMRIAARRHDWARVLRVARGLPGLQASLQSFEDLPA
jgi:hypothetical protein